MCSIMPVELLKRQFLQHVEVERLRLPSNDVLRSPGTQMQIYDSMFSKSALSYPPSHRYQYRVLKRLVSAMEQAIADPEEDVWLYSLSDSTVTSP